MNAWPQHAPADQCFDHLEQTKQFADDIRSQVAEKSRELAELNERGGSIGT